MKYRMKLCQLKTFYEMKYMGQFITIYLENVDDKVLSKSAVLKVQKNGKLK